MVDAGDLQHVGRHRAVAGRAQHRHLAADADAEVLGQEVAQDRRIGVAGGQVAALRDRRGDRRDPRFARRVDADHDGGVAARAIGEDGEAVDPRRGDSHARDALGLMRQLLGLGDRAVERRVVGVAGRLQLGVAVEDAQRRLFHRARRRPSWNDSTKTSRPETMAMLSRLSSVRCGRRQRLRQASAASIAQDLGFCRFESVKK